MSESPGQVDFTAKSPRPVTSRNAGPVSKSAAQQARYEVIPGVRPSAGDGDGEPPPGVGAQDDGSYTVNLDAASVTEAAKLILAETLGLNYTMDPNLQASVTMVSSRPLTSRQLIDAFEAALRAANVALVQSNGNFKLILGQQVMDGDVGRLDRGKEVSAGYGISAVPLRFVSAASLAELLDGFATQAGSARPWKAGNMILIRGTAAQRRTLVDVVLSFDVDSMKNQTTGIAAIENGRAEDIAGRLTRIFAIDSPGADPNALRIIPVPGINSLIVISASPERVRRAMSWIKRLDQQSLDSPKSYVYAVQNGNAVDLARILSSAYGSGSGGGATAEVAPDKETVNVPVDAGADQQQPGGQGLGSGQQQTGMGGADSMTTQSITPDAPAGADGSGAASSSGVRITPIPANNTLLIRATPRDYRDILATLKQIDAPATQVMINATIVEVKLNNELQYGVQAYFKNNNFDVLFTKGDTAGISPPVPGLNLFLGSLSDPKVIINALSKITKVRVVSSPSLLVMENEPATIKVGDSVPIQTQQQTANNGGNDIINSYQYRDTGVLLKVKPRVSARGVVTIELGQELTGALLETGVGDNPVFTQRTINSKVSVNDQQTVLLGGLIKGEEESGRTTLPGADKVPLFGKLVGTTDKSGQRTEMIVFITPTIVRNGEEAAQASESLRDKMKNLTFD